MTPEERADLLCHAFVRLQSKIPVPLEISGVIITFYLQIFTFNQENYGDDLEFINDMTIKKTSAERWSHWSLCSIGEAITSEMCSTFKITYKWLKMSPLAQFRCIGIGFLSHMELGRWDICIGGGPNKHPSFGIELEAPTYKHHGYEYDSTTSQRKKFGEKDNGHEFKEGDKFTLEYNFDAKTITIHDAETVHTMEVVENIEQIIPAVSLFDAGDVIEIVDCQFIY